MYLSTGTYYSRVGRHNMAPSMVSCPATVASPNQADEHGSVTKRSLSAVDAVEIAGLARTLIIAGMIGVWFPVWATS